jgi:ubiquinone/menaquinone biosynthesis C-methylase UbiE
MDLEEEAAAYAEADFEEVNEAFVEDLLEVAGDATAISIVDLGCGPGDIPRRIREARPAWRVVAVDASRPMLRLGRSAAPEVRFVQADAKALPFPSATFDLVLSNSILHHVSDPVVFWRAAVAAARPGGLLFVRDLMRPDSPESAQDLVDIYAETASPLLRESFFRSLLAAYTLGEVRHQLKTAGISGMTVRAASDRHVDVFGRIAG